MKFLRFGYIVPRLVLLALLYLATEVGSGYAIRWGMIASGEAAVGARVEVASVKSSLLQTRVAIRDVTVANPRKPMTNLLEADRIEIDFDSNALLRKKLIADYAVVSGLEFSTPRETTGALPDAPPEDEEPAAPGWITPVASQYADAWVTDLESRFDADIRQQLESVRLAEELAQKWPNKYKALEAQAKAIKAEAKQLEQEVRVAKQNPLRNAEFITQIPDRVTKLRRSLRDLQTEVTKLPNELKTDRDRITLARKNDERMLREKLELGELDAKSLSNYLLGEKVTGPLTETVGWIRWARKLMPARGEKVVVAPKHRGEDIFFPGSERLPDVLIRAVRLDGSARVSGQPVEIVGVVRDWTNQPEWHTKPTTLELTTKGGLPLTVEATFDRTQEVSHDEVHCVASDIVIPDASLGRAGKLHLAVAPSHANVVLALHLVDDKIEGTLEITQSGLAISPTIGAGSFGTRLQTALAGTVGRIHEAKTVVAVSGTLDDPDFDLDSTLGTELASAISRSAREVVTVERERLLAKGQQEMDKHVAKLNGELVAFQQKLNSELQGPGEVIASLLGQRGDDPQIGQSPFGQLFK